MKRDNNKLSCEKLLVIKTSEREGGGWNGDRKTITEIAVVQWNVNGSPKQPKLEKRQYYEDNGQIKSGKAEGFTADDFAVVLAAAEGIKRAMSNGGRKKEIYDSPIADVASGDDMPF